MPTPVTLYTFGRGGEVLAEQTVDLDGDEEARHLAPEHLRQAYQTLRDWAEDARSVEAGWDTMTAGQKDAALRALFGRTGTYLDRVADLLAVLDRG